jgi:hypothetical protein
MIAPCGTGDYRVIVEPDMSRQNRWIGRAHSLRDSSIHPGMAGKRPLFELEGDLITLRATESKISFWMNRRYRPWGRPFGSDMFEVSNIPAVVLQAGDQLSFHRHGTGDYALTIIRNESLILGIGSIAGLPLGKDVQIEEDKRVKDMYLYELANDLDRLDDLESQIFWIDAGKGNLETQLKQIKCAPKHNDLVVAIKYSIAKGEKRQAIPDLWEKILNLSGDHSCSIYPVDAQYATKQDWLDYVKQLPREHPDDLHVNITTGGEQIKLCEGQRAQIGAYYAQVERVYRWGIPGELSSLGIGLTSSTLTPNMIIESAKVMASRK